MDLVPLYAGTWGQKLRALEDRRRQEDGMHKSKASEHFTTETRQKYSLMAKHDLSKVQDSKYHKFKSLQQSGSAIITPPPSAGDEEEAMQTRLSTASLSSPGNRLSTTLRDSYKSPFPKDDDDFPLTFHRTQSKLLRSPSAPIAKGRSGLRKEKGVSTSGLLGERLYLSNDPSTNTLAQKTWLYTEDPALKVKLQGRPKVERTAEIAQLSLQIGREESDGEQREEEEPEQYGRRMIVTGGVLTKSGYARSGVFLDDFDQRVRESLHVHSR